MAVYVFDGTMTGLLCCVFRAFQFKEFDVKVQTEGNAHQNLFDESVRVYSEEKQAERVWQGLKSKISASSLRNWYFTFLSEQEVAYQHLFDYSIYIFKHQYAVEKNFGHHDVLALAQWAKQVGREKHRMEAFVRFKKCKDGLFLSLVRPDFNVLPLISKHFKARYQDQRWLIYDEKRRYGIYYDLKQVHQVNLNAAEIDQNIHIGSSQSFMIELDDQEELYDQLWKDYFKSVNIVARDNPKLHVQYVPKRYWRYMNEKRV
ncbi:TIGR03915 family putative DNA repair protein [Acinetobacter sp. YH16032]|uniref:TIGR03915 family putative DNA repair protein n=1 Tax=Acinetobacter sp. YH16032 TaxID=2601181 RepID=UPI0015D2DC75|nr:TIGR03915 family putative DNA repair protein [Acinetobacter sp. YH16032]